MKLILNIVGFAIVILLFTRCGNNVSASAEQSSSDTSYYFIKRILNASPEQVELVLGKPDGAIVNTNDCSHLPNCSVANYRNGEYELEYFENRVKCVTINNAGSKVYDESFLASLNFKSKPSVKSSNVIRWKDIEGVEEAMLFPGQGNKVDYAMIEVQKDYNSSFITE